MRWRAISVQCAALAAIAACRHQSTPILRPVETDQPGRQDSTLVRPVIQLLRQKAAEIRHTDRGSVVSAASRASDALRFYWIRLKGPDVHDFAFVTAVRFRGHTFDPAKLQEWDVVWAEWVPRSSEEALKICEEAVAVGVLNEPTRTEYRDLIELSTAGRFVHPDDRRRVREADRTPVVRAPAPGGLWSVTFWYPNFRERPTPDRIATRYECRIPSTPSQPGFEISEVEHLAAAQAD